MKVPGPFVASTLLALAFFAGQAPGAHTSLARRQNSESPSESPSISSRIDGGRETGTSTTLRDFPTPSATDSSVPVQTSSPAPDPATVPPAGSSLNETLLQHQTPQGQLPLTPVITPGWAVAGVILLGTGVVYALVGIKTKWLHTFLSMGFSASLGTTVLILYVMTPPVSNAMQGAYVVAAVCTGLVLGVLAVVFKEVTECLGCLLGGFTLSMWLLALQPGGLIPSVGGKVGLIAVFTIGGTCLYFTKWTRTYGLICGISFTGSTVAVLGIDCFSRAGLREFWAYIWALNDHLFPLGAVTYPLTRGIRVELAVTILLFFAGIFSQLKLWRVVKERRAKKDAELAEGERNLRIEEENVGRQVEETNSRERREWERVHGNGGARGGDSASQLGLSDDSGIGDMGSEKEVCKGTSDTTITISTLPQSVVEADTATAPPDSPLGRAPTPLSLDQALAMAERATTGDDIPANDRTIGRRALDGDIRHGKPSPALLSEGFGPGIGPGEETGHASPVLTQPASTQGDPPIPPIPSAVPAPLAVTDPASDDSSSSMATFAADDDDGCGEIPHMSSRGSDANLALSTSQNIPRSFSNLPRQSFPSPDGGAEGVSEGSAASTVESSLSVHEESDSVMANLGGLSVDGRSTEDGVVSPTSGKPMLSSLAVAEGTDADATANWQRMYEGSPENTSSPEMGRSDETNTTKLPRSISEEKDGGRASVPPVEEGGFQGCSAPEGAADRSSSGAPVDPAAGHLTEGNLPPPLSRMAKSYRTNEWAKHLSIAEAPIMESEQLPESYSSDSLGSPAVGEDPAPVNVWELQQTPTSAVLPPAAPRPVIPGSVPGIGRVASGRSLRVPLAATSAAIVQPSPSFSPVRNPRSQSPALYAQPMDGRSSSSTRLSHVPAPGSPKPPGARASTPSYAIRELSASTLPSTSSTPQHNTLIGMREALLRNKASYGQFLPQHGDIVPLVHPPTISETESSGGLVPGGRSPWPVNSDDDDMPLSQRRALIRRSNPNVSMANHKAAYSGPRALSPPLSVPVTTAETAVFNSHQPQRHSTAPSEAVRQAQLATFRNSVAMDLRANRSATPPVQGPGLIARAMNSGEYGRGVNVGVGSSLGRLGGTPLGGDIGHGVGRDQDPRRKTSLMILRAENEAGVERERATERDFLVEERMRSSAMMEAHRDALRRMQSGVRNL